MDRKVKQTKPPTHPLWLAMRKAASSRSPQTFLEAQNAFNKRRAELVKELLSMYWSDEIKDLRL